jgi:hypothetical protein
LPGPVALGDQLDDFAYPGPALYENHVTGLDFVPYPFEVTEGRGGKGAFMLEPVDNGGADPFDHRTDFVRIIY